MCHGSNYNLLLHNLHSVLISKYEIGRSMCRGIKDGVNVAAGQQFPLMCNENVDDLCFYIVMLMNPNIFKGILGHVGKYARLVFLPGVQ